MSLEKIIPKYPPHNWRSLAEDAGHQFLPNFPKLFYKGEDMITLIEAGPVDKIKNVFDLEGLKFDQEILKDCEVSYTYSKSQFHLWHKDKSMCFWEMNGYFHYPW